jgi:NifU-like protein involved in Fe-S cluster formation
MNTTEDLQSRIEAAIRDPKNMGEMEGADAVGAAGSAGCGDMIRLWLKFKEQAGKKVIDRATFQSFGCQTAIAVASMATELIRGKTREEVLAMRPEELAPGLGPLPPVKIHCSQLVESALHAALNSGPLPINDSPARAASVASLVDNFTQHARPPGSLRIVLLDEKGQ